MADTTKVSKKKTTQESTVPAKDPQELAQDLKKNVEKSMNDFVWEQNINKAKEAGKKLSWAAQETKDMVSSQLGTISDKLGGEELVWELSDMAKPIAALVTNVLMIAFFVKKQDRVSRWQYIIGSLAVFIIMGLFVSILSAIVGPMGVRGGLIFIVAPLINLSIKRFQDIWRSPWWSATIIIPFVGWVVPVLFQGEKWENDYGPNPTQEDTTDLTSYLVSGLGLFVISMLVTTLLGFLGLRVSSPDVDVTDPNMIGEEIWDQAPWQLWQPVQKVDNLWQDVKNMGDDAASTTRRTLR